MSVVPPLVTKQYPHVLGDELQTRYCRLFGVFCLVTLKLKSRTACPSVDCCCRCAVTAVDSQLSFSVFLPPCRTVHGVPPSIWVGVCCFGLSAFFGGALLVVSFSCCFLFAPVVCQQSHRRRWHRISLSSLRDLKVNSAALMYD